MTHSHALSAITHTALPLLYLLFMGSQVAMQFLRPQEGGAVHGKAYVQGPVPHLGQAEC